MVVLVPPAMRLLRNRSGSILGILAAPPNQHIQMRLLGMPFAIGALACVLAGCTTSDQPTTLNPMDEFGITANNAFFYYADLDAATEFYTGTLGLPIVADYGFAVILQVAPTSLLTLVDEASGMHSSEQPKTVAIALVTDQLDEWFDYISSLDVELKFGYDPQEGRAHHGFVAIDPEGYLLEFERFNDHPENVDFMPVLAETESLAVNPTVEGAPKGLGFKATVLWTYYRDMDRAQRFYEETMGLDLLVDQGWAKVYRTSGSGTSGWSMRREACTRSPRRKR